MGNELADTAAKTAAQLDQSGVTWGPGAARAAIRHHFNTTNRDTWPSTLAAYNNNFPDWRREANMLCADRVRLARFRSGHSPMLNNFKLKIDSTADASCRMCNAAEESSHHILLDCPGVMDVRERELGEAAPSDWIRRPDRCLALLDEFLRRVEL